VYRRNLKQSLKFMLKYRKALITRNNKIIIIELKIDKLIEGADIVRFIKAQRIKWLGHIQRMDRARPTRKLLDWKPMGTRPVGRTRQRWQKDVMEDLKKLKVKNWKEAAKDRRTWRNLAEKVKTQRGFYCEMMMMMIIELKYFGQAFLNF
jgi:hypothetical protein